MIDTKRLVHLMRQRTLFVEWQGEKENKNIERPANDSRKVGPNDVFIAIRGEQVDGHLFIEKAVKNGAIAVVCEVMPEEATLRFPGITFIKVRNTRAALAEIAALYYDYPAHSLIMIGITGTNGKTTTAFLVHQMMSYLGYSCGLISTIEYRMNDRSEAASHTTPDALEFHKMLRRMVDEKCTACVMEVSSHALIQERVKGIAYDIAIFTNLSQDHLDYHGNMQSYFKAKKKLFDDLHPTAAAIYNSDDEAGARIVSGTKGQRISYGLRKEAAFKGHVITNDLNGLRMSIEGASRQFNLVGLFNAYNLLAAYATGRMLGHNKDAISKALSQVQPIRGRFEILSVSKKRYVIIDYAHTPDALENVLRTIRETVSPETILWCVFGCGGDRDRQKRPLMGRIAEQYADRIIVTSDNPRTEDPESILEDIKTGILIPENAFWISDRRSAIYESARRSSEGDVVLIAGKGHETYQVINSESRPFDDREEALAAFKS